MSTASEPEFVKNTWSRPAGAICTSAFGELERGRVAHLERRRVVHDFELPRDRLGDLAAAVTGVHAPQARGAVEDLPAVRRLVVHARRARQHARLGLELAVRRERHPVGVERSDAV